MTLPAYEPTGLALELFKDRYALHPEESFSKACRRVADYIAGAEAESSREEFARRFYDMMVQNRFSPGGRIWRGAGRAKPNMLNCYVISDAIDSREGWGDTLRNVTIISGLGGGVGINFSQVRPRGSKIAGTGGEATGSVSLMHAVNAVCNELRGGGNRRSALSFALRYDHPDILEFLSAKLDHKQLNNANISVLIDDEFLRLVDEDQEIVFWWQGQERGRTRARELWNKSVENAWKSGEPGLLNIGLANRLNTIAYRIDLIGVNPCAEQWLSPFDACDLGSINLAAHVIDGKLDLDFLDDTIRMAVRFLDDVLDRNHYPLPEVEETCHKHRRIGLGVMGLHDMLLEMGLKYSSDEGLAETNRVMDFIKRHAYEASIILAVEKGSFPVLDRDAHVTTGFAKECLTPKIRSMIREYGIRNCCVLTLAPTGTTSIMAGVSSGIEPMFAPVYERRFNVHKSMHDSEREQGVEMVVHPLVKKFLVQERSIDHFEGAHEISPEWHCRVQEVCQRHIDASISKTINVPEDYPIDELSRIMRQYIRNLKGITVYRDGSRGQSPLVPVPIDEAEKYLSTLREQAAVQECSTGACSL